MIILQVLLKINQQLNGNRIHGTEMPNFKGNTIRKGNRLEEIMIILINHSMGHIPIMILGCNININIKITCIGRLSQETYIPCSTGQMQSTDHYLIHQAYHSTAITIRIALMIRNNLLKVLRRILNAITCNRNILGFHLVLLRDSTILHFHPFQWTFQWTILNLQMHHFHV